MFELEYTRTNESLMAPIIGLDLQNSDRLYSVGGSGDFAFASLEFVESVFVADNNPRQIEFMEKRMGAACCYDFLKIGLGGSQDAIYLGESNPDFARFNLDRRNAYFSRSWTSFDNRFDRIVKKIKEFVLLESDFFEGLSVVDSVDKIYLSNVRESSFIDTYGNYFEAMFDKLTSGGLVYISDRYIFSGDVRRKYDAGEFGFSIDDKLTSLAVDIELNSSAAFGKDYYPMWYPLVLRKTN